MYENFVAWRWFNFKWNNWRTFIIKNYELLQITFTGNEAQELLYSQTFDLLILDVNVPDIKMVLNFEI